MFISFRFALHEITQFMFKFHLDFLKMRRKISFKSLKRSEDHGRWTQDRVKIVEDAQMS